MLTDHKSSTLLQKKKHERQRIALDAFIDIYGAEDPRKIPKEHLEA